jgi:hypothetical protein
MAVIPRGINQTPAYKALWQCDGYNSFCMSFSGRAQSAVMWNGRCHASCRLILFWVDDDIVKRCNNQNKVAGCATNVALLDLFYYYVV